MSDSLSDNSFHNEPAPNKRRALGCGLAILIIVVALVLAKLLVMGKKQPEAKQAEETVWNVRAQAIEPSSYQPSVALYGRAESARDATLSAAVSADVSQVFILAGNSVRKGERLIQLDDRETRLALAQAEADFKLLEQQGKTDKIALEKERHLLGLTRKEYDRFIDLKKRGLGSQAQVDQGRQSLQRQELAVAQRELAVAQFSARKAQSQSRLERAKLDQERTQITAPFAGEVTKVNIAQGDRVAPGQALVSLYDPSVIEIRAAVPNRYLAALRQAQKQRTDIPASLNIDGQSIAMKLVRLAAASSVGSGSTDAYFRPVDASQAPGPGRNASLRLSMPPVPNSTVVPFEAVYGLNSVYRVVDERLESVAIERLGDFPPLAGSNQPRLLIRSELLQNGDQVLATQLAVAINGLKVAVVETIPAPE